MRREPEAEWLGRRGREPGNGAAASEAEAGEISYVINGYWQVNRDGEWPCGAPEASPFKMVKICTDDILVKSGDGTFVKHTGLGRFGIRIPDKDITRFSDKSIRIYL